MASRRSSEMDPNQLEKQEEVEDSESMSSGVAEPPREALSRVASVAKSFTSGISASRSTYSHPLGHQKTSQDVLVDFDGEDDPLRPMNWPLRKKRITVIICALISATTTMASSIYASAIPAVSEEFHVGTVTSTLGLSLFLIGFGVGPLLWAPLSETFGRRIATMPAFFIGISFTFGTAAAKDIQTIMITRFFTGFFAASPVAVTGGVLADLFSARNRGAAMAMYQLSVVGGPLTAPLIGGAIADSSVSWRWMEYVSGIVMSVALIISLLVVDESYAPVILVRKARRLRIATGNWALHAKHEEWDVTFSELAHKYLVRPFQLLGTPICFSMCTYCAFVYALIYMQFAAFPIVYQEGRGWNALIGSMAFMATLVGIVIGLGITFCFSKLYVKAFIANNNKPVPEARLYIAMVGSISLPVGLFIFGWTSNPDIFWFPSYIGAALIGMAFVCTFQGTLTYLIDTFQMYAASATAANTVYRCVLAGAFPLFTNQMFHTLGTEWACTLLGCIAILMMPLPFIFYIFGRRIRARGKWSASSVL